MPQKVVTDEVWQVMRDEGWGFAVEEGGQALSADNYLKFIVGELKPFIDETYRTQSDRGNTLVMGSSMGGLISAYALAEYPGVFGGAACLSTDWRYGDGAVVRWLSDHLPSAGTHRIYFDHGTETYDAYYGPFQRQMDEVMATARLRVRRRLGSRFVSRVPTTRREAWRERLHIPLKFLLGKP